MSPSINHALHPEWLALATHLGRIASARAAMVAGAESCTGGLIAATLTAVGGSSTWFDRAFVTYSNEAKQELIGVSAATLARHGAVSEPTATEMARGALRTSHATLAYAVTGIAGPSGGSADKPVGTVCFAFADQHGVQSSTARFSGDRSAVREQSVNYVLGELVRRLEIAAPLGAETVPESRL
ncbi:MAG: nicotinamide-nucleotide amidohydrolase family protein [Burkholderiales bacterium]|nr:nicotinamide-nucleotide amidohydrolase family protein [Burkholderiales bacterium]